MYNSVQYVSLDDLYVSDYRRQGIVPAFTTGSFTTPFCEPQKKEENMAMEKYFTHSGSGTKYKTQDDATIAAKKYLDSMSKNYGSNSDIYILEAVACVTFPVPAYEVVALVTPAKV